MKVATSQISAYCQKFKDLTVVFSKFGETISIFSCSIISTNLAKQVLFLEVFVCMFCVCVCVCPCNDSKTDKQKLM